MLCYRCGSHVPDGTENCGTCGQKFALGLKPGPIAGFGTGTRRHRIAVETSPYKVGDVIAGRFEIRDNVGAGPVGWVYKCLDRDIDVDVAVKVVSPRLLQAAEERRKLSVELRQVRKLSHPNVCRVYEDGEDQGKLFFTMQHLEGLTLRRIWDLRRQKGQLFALREVEPIVQQIAQAVEDAHAQGVTHGDLKPDNIVVLPDLLKVTDFGVANALPRAPFMAAQKTGGVHRYLAPEFLHGERIAPQADVYSIGVILGEMLSGVPFEGQGFDLLARNPNLSREVDALFRKATAFKPEERFASPMELANALSNAAGVAPRTSTAKAVTKAVTAAQPAISKAPPQPAPAPREETKSYDDHEIEEVDDDDVTEAAPVVHVQQAASRKGETTALPKVPPAPEAPAPKAAPPPPPAAPTKAPELKVEAKKPEPTPAPKVEAKKPEPTPAPKIEAKKPEPKPEPKKEEPKKLEQTPSRKDRKAEAKKAEQKPEPKKEEPKKDEKKSAAAEPAWSKGGAPAVPPPAALPPAAQQQPSQKGPMVVAAGLVVVIAAVFVYLAATSKRPVPQEPVVEPVAVVEPKPVEPVVEPAVEPAADPVVEQKPPVADPKVAKVEPKVEPKVDPKAAEPKVDPKAEAKAKAEADAARRREEEKRRQDEALAKLETESKAKAEAERLVKARAEAEAKARAEAERLAKERAAEAEAKAEAAKAKAEAEAKAKAEAEKAKAAAVTASATTGSCPDGMRFIPAGTFKFGAPDTDDMKNFGEIDLSTEETKGYCIDAYEFPNRARLAPTANVTWKQAADSCRAKKKRLCTEMEWERACKGTGGLRYPYGKNFDANACSTEDANGDPRSPGPSGEFAKCGSGYGVFDLSGNVAEWVDASYVDGGSEKVLKGGSADRPDFATRCAARAKKSPNAKDAMIGFRCCADPK